MTEFDQELAKEFGGVWTQISDENTHAFQATFDAVQGAKLVAWLNKYRCQPVIETVGDFVTITVLRPSEVLDVAAQTCGRYEKPENAHVTVQSILNHVNPEIGRSRKP